MIELLVRISLLKFSIFEKEFNKYYECLNLIYTKLYFQKINKILSIIKIKWAKNYILFKPNLNTKDNVWNESKKFF